MKSKAKKTILVIEDDHAVLESLAKFLESFDYEVIQAADGLEGLKKLETCRYDLVITDIVMPYISGVGVVSVLKQKRPQIPVIAITGYGREPEMAAIEKEADLVLAKPLRLESLKGQIEKILGDGQREEGR